MSESDGARESGLKRALHWVGSALRGRNGESQHLRETLEEIISEIDESDEEAAAPISSDERVMLSNILKLRHLTAYDVMVPRADIVAAQVSTSFDTLIEELRRAGHSRLPVYRESLDDVVGMVHIKDVLTAAREPKRFRLSNVLRPLDVVAPSMRVLDLLLEMQLKHSHMVLVVDEFGGIDGLVTIEDLVEEIVGEIEDEHDVGEGPSLVRRADGTVMVDGRLPIEELEAELGDILSEEEREEDIDTLGGLVFYLADRVPARGELIEHEASGLVFEVVQADPRRVKRLRLRNVPKSAAVASPPVAAES
jgi:CBS domain containing-hemolysin-like protein